MKFELAHLKFHTRNALAKISKELLRTGNFEPFAYIILDERQVREFPFQGDWMSSARKKDFIFAVFGELCRRTQAPGLVLVTDGFALDYTPEQEKLMREDPAWLAGFQELSQNRGLAATAAAGYGRLVETIVCQGQTRENVYGLYQYYDRVAADGVIPAHQATGNTPLPAHKIRLRGSPVIISAGRGEGATGRIMTLFEDGGNPDVSPQVTAIVNDLFDQFEGLHK